MNTEYTLVSSVGTGMYKSEGGYRKTTYKFPDGSEYSSNLFLESLLRKKYKPIKKIILAGTKTSSWDILIADENSEGLDLWIAVKSACESKNGIDETLIEKMEAALVRKYQLPVVLKVHTPTIDYETAETIFSVYSSIDSEILPNTEILLDITHGFRSMPVLLYQALQFSAVGKKQKRIELVYGEYIDQEKLSYVRNLSPYWDYAEITAAKNLFIRKLDGKLLAEKIAPYWENGAKCIRRFTEIVECNFSLQIPEVLRQMKNLLDKPGFSDTTPDWVLETAKILETIHKFLSDETTSGILRRYSELLEEKGLITQAVIALQVALETAVTEKYGNENHIGDYDWWQQYGKQNFDEIKKENKIIRSDLNRLEFLRNQIAHGGGRDSKTREYPHLSAVAGILKRGKAAATDVFEKLHF